MCYSELMFEEVQVCIHKVALRKGPRFQKQRHPAVEDAVRNVAELALVRIRDRDHSRQIDVT